MSANWLIAANDLAWVKIQRTFSFFNRHAGHRVGVNDHRFQIVVAKQFLNCAIIDVRRPVNGTNETVIIMPRSALSWAFLSPLCNN